jgi:hypothetical protein
MFRFTELIFVVATWSLASAHTVIVYPGWRGNNILTNGTMSDTDPAIKPGSLGINYENGTYGFPYGMQWMYPCMSNRLGGCTEKLLTSQQAAVCPCRKTEHYGL